MPHALPFQWNATTVVCVVVVFDVPYIVTFVGLHDPAPLSVITTFGTPPVNAGVNVTVVVVLPAAIDDEPDRVSFCADMSCQPAPPVSGLVVLLSPVESH